MASLPDSNSILLEVACFNLESAIAAISAGAQRIEYCADRESGGLTPENVEDLNVLEGTDGPSGPVSIITMIRSNRDPGFIVSNEDVAKMQASITEFKPHVSGFVFGVLTADGSIDVSTCEQLVKLASPLPCTFHRAFDHAKHPLTDKLDIVRRCGFKRILTSGGVHDATSGKDVLKSTVTRSGPLGIEVVVGGGVRSSNVSDLVQATGAKAFHSAATDPGTDVVSIHEVARIKAELLESNASQ